MSNVTPKKTARGPPKRESSGFLSSAQEKFWDNVRENTESAVPIDDIFEASILFSAVRRTLADIIRQYLGLQVVERQHGLSKGVTQYVLHEGAKYSEECF